MLLDQDIVIIDKINALQEQEKSYQDIIHKVRYFLEYRKDYYHLRIMFYIGRVYEDKVRKRYKLINYLDFYSNSYGKSNLSTYTDRFKLESNVKAIHQFYDVLPSEFIWFELIEYTLEGQTRTIDEFPND